MRDDLDAARMVDVAWKRLRRERRRYREVGSTGAFRLSNPLGEAPERAGFR